MDVYSTLTRSKEDFVTINKNRVNLFVCGPTVYDDAHIGHGRTYISFDTIKRYLEYSGYAVFYIQNITDIDDKIINRSKESGIPAHELARKFERRYIEDMNKLNVNGVNLFARATDHVDRNIEELESHRDLADTTKKNPQDFALWKKREGVDEPTWPSPWGDGRPGWHIEDTAITEYYFGPQYDAHGGGLDLIFPHHEAEITQMEAVSGKAPMVKFWLHTGFLNVNGEKMSKSLNNFITIRELLKDYAPETFRFFVLSTHYRSPIDFSKDSLHQSEKSLDRIRKYYELLDIEVGDESYESDVLAPHKKEFFDSMDDDFNTPKAIAAIFGLINDTKNELDSLSDDDKKAIKSFLDDAAHIFGVSFELEDVNAGSDDLLDLISEVRSELRANKQYDLSDKIRDSLQSLGYEIND